MKSISNIGVVLALILIGMVIGLALSGQGDGGEDGQTSAAAATSTPTAVPTATESSGAESESEKGVIVRVTDSDTLTAPAGCPCPDPTPGVVVRVADGDTLTVRFDNGEKETIRLLDVDTPETVHPNRPEECYGAQASDFTKTLMGQRVWVEEEGRDRYDRLLAYVWTGNGEDSVLWNVRLLEEGLAVYNDYGNPGQYADTTRAAAEKAMLAGVGLWSACEIGEKPTPVPMPVPTQLVGAGCPQGCISQPEPSCSIKGNVNTRGTKIYHVEGASSSYGRVNMKEEEGDLWFCTREEAEANGFRAPYR